MWMDQLTLSLLGISHDAPSTPPLAERLQLGSNQNLRVDGLSQLGFVCLWEPAVVLRLLRHCS